jgi:dGTPase
MDWADDVSYAIHDMEDFYKEHLIPVDRLASDEAERARFIDYHLQVRNGDPDVDHETAERLFYHSPMVTKRFDQSRNARLDLRAFSSSMISRFVTAPILVESSSHPRGRDLEISTDVRSEIRILKSLLFYYVLDQPSLQSVRHGYVRLIHQLFDILLEITVEKRGKRSILPKPVQESLELNVSPQRVIADFIAGMTDIQVISYYRRLTGISFGDSFDVIV